jgi:hypothetical protein
MIQNIVTTAPSAEQLVIDPRGITEEKNETLEKLQAWIRIIADFRLLLAYLDDGMNNELQRATRPGEQIDPRMIKPCPSGRKTQLPCGVDTLDQECVSNYYTLMWGTYWDLKLPILPFGLVCLMLPWGVFTILIYGFTNWAINRGIGQAKVSLIWQVFLPMFLFPIAVRLIWRIGAFWLRQTLKLDAAESCVRNNPFNSRNSTLPDNVVTQDDFFDTEKIRNIIWDESCKNVADMITEYYGRPNLIKISQLRSNISFLPVLPTKRKIFYCTIVVLLAGGIGAAAPNIPNKFWGFSLHSIHSSMIRAGVLGLVLGAICTNLDGLFFSFL